MSTHYGVSKCPDWLCCPMLRKSDCSLAAHLSTTASNRNSFDAALLLALDAVMCNNEIVWCRMKDGLRR